jgi:hypothetical protein
MCPSLYQLFPEVRHSFIWNSKSSNSTVPTDDSTLGVQVGLNPSHMNAWKAFRQGLTNNRPANVRYAYIVGSRQETITRFIWDGAKSLRVEEIEDAGDGTVSLLGAMDIGTQTDFVGKSHVTLIETKPARETLASVFGGTTTFDVPAITLDVRYLAVSTIDPVHVQIGLNGADQVKGKLSFQRADIPDTNAPPNAPEFVDVSFVTTLPVSVTSAGIEFLNIKCPPITVAGIYRPKFVDDGGGPPALGPKFVVQKND